LESLGVTDLLIRNIDPHLKKQLQESARNHGRSLSEEARLLLKKALLAPPDRRKMGQALLKLFPEECRGDDLVFEVPGEISRPPDFE
jgi:plasmid stability protein